MARSKTEIKAVSDLLLQDWETPEDLAAAIIDALDKARASKTRYVGVMQFGQGPSVFYVGLGPYPGQKSAENALRNHPSAGMAHRMAVVPTTTAEGLEQKLAELDAPPVAVVKDRAKDKKLANQKFAALMSKERTHIVADKVSVVPAPKP